VNSLQETVNRQEEELRTLRAQQSSDVIDDMSKVQKDLIAERDLLQDQLELLQVELSKTQRPG
jgi:hypothetical protein